MTKVQHCYTEQDIHEFRSSGACCVRGLFADWVGTIEKGIERNLRDAGPMASENTAPGAAGRFFDDYCNWERIPEFSEVVRQSPAAEVAAAFMGSTTAQFFHDHVLVKEPGTQMETPWHQDSPYYFVEGSQTVSFWIPVDPVGGSTLRLIAGSHLWPKLVRPVRWATQEAFYQGDDDYLPTPDPESDHRLKVLEWSLEPGDAVLFDFRTVHSARGNHTSARRRVLSLRWVGNDARYVPRPGRTSPPYPGHGMRAGERLRVDMFPVIWPQSSGGSGTDIS